MRNRQDKPVVSLQNVSKRFGTVTALNNISFTINKGEIVALLGPNGAGKTTAISLMLGLGKPTSGEITLFGEAPRNPKSHMHVSSMLQESNVPGILRVREVLELFKRLYASRKTVEEALLASALELKVNSRVDKLSGGERQRLYFALCVIADVDLLFLDEPTVAMDVKSRRLFWEQIEAMSRNGKTIVLTTHYLEEADALAERVIVVNHGEIIAEGSPSEIKSRVSGKFVRFYSANLNDEMLVNLDDVRSVKRKGGLVSFRTFHPESVLQQLFAFGVDIKDLEVNSVGLFPFVTLGFFLGYVSGPTSATIIANLIFLPLSFASGLFIPLQMLPKFIQQAAPYLPSYNVAQLGWTALGAHTGRSAGTNLGYITIYTMIFLVMSIIVYRRDQGRKFS